MSNTGLEVFITWFITNVLQKRYYVFIVSDIAPAPLFVKLEVNEDDPRFSKVLMNYDYKQAQTFTRKQAVVIQKELTEWGDSAFIIKEKNVHTLYEN